MAKVREDVPEALDGQRVDRVVAMLTGLSRTEAADLVTGGGVVVDDRVVTRGADRLVSGAALVITVPDVVPPPGPEAEPDVDIPVVHLDDDVVVVDKPADLVVHPGAGHLHGTMVGGLVARFPEIVDVGQPDRPGIVHRLDRGTSGLLVVARSARAYRHLVDQLASRTVERAYRTLVWGHPDSPRGVVDAPIGRSPRHPTKMAVTATGKEARTRYEVQHRYEQPSPTAELTCRLETGRTHQIRVHLAAIGHPVVGDDRYGGVRESIDIGRPFLHAEHLAFDHPATGERLTFTSTLPDDLESVLALVRDAAR